MFEFDKADNMKMVRNYYLDDESKEVFENVKEDEANLPSWIKISNLIQTTFDMI